MILLYPEGQKLENMLSWHYSGFNVYIGDRIEPDDGVAKVIYTSKDRKPKKCLLLWTGLPGW